MYETIFKRRDVRRFRSDPIKPETLARLLYAAHHAPSVGYMQPWNFLVVTDALLRQQIFNHVEAERIRAGNGFEDERRTQYLKFKLEGIREAPVGMCVTCDPDRAGAAVIGRNTIRETDVYSVCCAVQNLWLAARADGIGVGWVSIYQNDCLRAILGIPEDIQIVAYLCIGYAEEFVDEPELETAGWRKRLPLEELVFSDQWGCPATTELLTALEARREELG